jgi:4'-phosphopantetheinyl transferase
MPSLPPRAARDRVAVWYAHIADLTPPLASRAQLWLNPAERERHARFRGDDDRQMFLLGRLMARALVGEALGLSPLGWSWVEGPRGRPEIAAPVTGLRFNLAHSGGLVTCALADERDVGVDVEDFARRRVDRAVVTRYCSPREIEDIEAAGSRWHDRFLVHWTLKEAYLKARGLGVAVTLADITCEAIDTDPRIAFSGSLSGTDDRWAFHLARPTDQHIVAVAACASDGRRPACDVARLDTPALADYLGSPA